MELSEYLKNILKLSDLLEEELKNLFETKELPKGDLLFKQGELCRQFEMTFNQSVFLI